MSEQRLKELMTELVSELEQMDSANGDTVALAKQLQANVHDLADPEVDTS